jgi:hypothetical protein
MRYGLLRPDFQHVIDNKDKTGAWRSALLELIGHATACIDGTLGLETLRRPSSVQEA